MIYFFLISCFSVVDRSTCSTTPVPSMAVCHALIDANNHVGRTLGPMQYFPTFKCVAIRDNTKERK